MTFDRDLQWSLTASRGFFWMNLVAAVWNAYLRNWGVAVACVVWAGNCWVWRRLAYSQQVTRDEIRIVEATIYDLRQEQR
jgi:hypothetical protein